MNIFRTWLHGLFREREDPTCDVSMTSFPSQTKGIDTFAIDHNEASIALYGQLLPKSGNLFFSPFSIRSVLARSYSGARGETAAQMREALRFPSSEAALHLEFSEIIQRLNIAGNRKEIIAVANSLWGQDGEPFQATFLDLLNQHYGSGIHRVDFRNEAEAARVSINQWVENKTKRKIQGLIPSGSLGDDARLVLVNAVYFMGKWALKFVREFTQDHTFYLEGGGKVKAPLMFQKEMVRYMAGRGFQAVDLGYLSGDLSMLVLLPNKKDGLRDLESKLSARMLFDCLAQMHSRKIMLFLPRFRITWGTFDLRGQLAALGMPLAFKPFKADFSGINGYEPPQVESLNIFSVFHKAFVEVNEEGTEAAAATGLTLFYGSSAAINKPKPVPLFKADHPFLFAIRDRKTGAILFLGRVTDPTLVS